MTDYVQKFKDLYAKLHNPDNQYFSKEGIPFHGSIRDTQIIVEAPNSLSQSTSEAVSYALWNDALYGKITGDWSQLSKTWNMMENYFIPSQQMQSSYSSYDPTKPATYSPEQNDITQYPVQMDQSNPKSTDPLANELKQKYGNVPYDMHWIIDVKNQAGFGGSDNTNPVYINTYQRGPHESVWKTIDQPCIEDFKYGNSSSGYLSLFEQDSNYSKQWKVTQAPDATSRAIQAIYWAYKWSGGNNSDVNALVVKASKMGDWLRYVLFDKYFKPIGCQNKATSCNDNSSCHYLQSWYSSWGGASSSAQYPWSYRIGCSHNHQGYQNPLSAWVLSTNQNFNTNMCQNASTMWGKSLKRQLQMYKWLQSAEGAIAGGCTNSYNGSYDQYPSGLTMFFEMAYLPHPAYLEPGSNQWFGFQTWSFERVLQYYNETKDDSIKSMIDKWIQWVIASVKIDLQNNIQIPSSLDWQGQPDNNFTDDNGWPADNTGLHVSITDYCQDTGIMASLARCLFYYSNSTGDQPSLKLGKQILDYIINNAATDLGYAFTEQRPDYVNFDQQVFVPSGYNGTTPSGDSIQSGATFISLRSFQKNDPLYPQIRKCIDNKQVFSYKYHRFWGESEVLLSLGIYQILFGNNSTSSSPSQNQLPQSTSQQLPTQQAPQTLQPKTNGQTGLQPSTSLPSPQPHPSGDISPVILPQKQQTVQNNSNSLTIKKSDFELNAIGSKLTLNGKDFRIKGINHFGFEVGSNCIEGLTKHNIDWYLDFYKQNKFNALRIPFAWDFAKNMDTVQPDPKWIDYSINPDLRGKTGGQIMDTFIQKAADKGILIMLDMHRINGLNNTIPALWYSQDVPESQIIQTWIDVANRYKTYYNVFAYDIANEKHDNIEVGTNSTTDWWYYCSRIGTKLLQVNPKALIFAEGYDKYVNTQKQHWDYPGWSATVRYLQDGQKVSISNQKKLVYSVHSYGSIQGDGNNTPQKLEDNYGFAVKQNIAPVVTGEWGGWVKSDGDWMTMCKDYMKSIDNTSNFFWCENPSSGDTGGLLLDDWTSIDTFKQSLLDDLNPNPPQISVNGDNITIINLMDLTQQQQQPTTPVQIQQPSQQSIQQPEQIVSQPQQQQSNSQLTLTIKDDNQWQEGGKNIKQQRIQIKNISTTPATNVILKVTNKPNVRQMWSMTWSDQTLLLPQWKQNIQPTEIHEFGWIICTDNQPTLSV